MQSLTCLRWAGVAGMLGGVLAVLFTFAHAFTHGATEVNFHHTLFGLTYLDYARLAVSWHVLLLLGF